MVLVQLLGQLGHQSGDALGEGDRGLEPEYGACVRQVGLGVAHVANAELAGDDGLGPVERGRDGTRDLEERVPLTAAHVEHTASSAGRALLVASSAGRALLVASSAGRA